MADRETPFIATRADAVLLVLLSGIVVFLLSFVLQIVAWELPVLLFARFGWPPDSDLPTLTALFVDAFGRRSYGYLTYVTWWFWWPMAGSFAYCHLRYTSPREFTLAFGFWFVLCWLLFIVYLSFVLLVCAMPFVIMASDLRGPLPLMSLVVPISWCIPILTAGVVVWALRRRNNSNA